MVLSYRVYMALVLSAISVTACAGESSALASALPPSTNCAPPDLASHGFDDGTFGPFNVGWGRETMLIVSDPTATGGRAVEKRWTSGSHDAAEIAGNWAGGDLPITKQQKRLYVRFRFKQDATFDNSGILKLVRFQQPGYGHLVGTLIIAWRQFTWTWDDLDQYTQQMNVNVGPDLRPDALRGSWHTYEVMNDLTTTGHLRMQMWIDGALKMDHTAPWSNAGATMGAVQFTGTFNAPAATATSWIDDLAVSTTCIGLPH